ncbi:MAG: hypothetical protein ACK4K0_09830 [Flavobacteriales bacterium]
MQLALHITLPVAYLLFILWIMGRLSFFKNAPFSAGALRFAFLLKVFSGLIIYYLYTVYYPVRMEADTFKYFDDSEIMFNALKKKPLDYFQMLFGLNCETTYFYENYFNDMNNWVRVYENTLYNDSRIVIRINAFFRLFSLGNYHVHSLLFSFMAFVGLTALAKLFYAYAQSKWKVFLAVFLIPSVVFWSSGVLKEGVLLLALGFFCVSVNKLISHKFNLNHLWIFLVCSMVLLIMKVYVFMALIPAAAGWWLSTKWNKTLLSFIVSVVFFLFGALLLGYLLPKYDLVQLLVNKQNDFVRMAQKYDINSAFEMNYLTPDILSFAKAMPGALLNTVTKPWLTELKSPLFVPAFIENIGLMTLLALAMVYRNKTALQQHRFLYFVLCFTLLLFVVLGLTTPVIGAMVRYKIPALPFFCMGILMLFNHEKLPSFLQKNKLITWIKLRL